MTEQNLIEQLKDPKQARPFGLLKKYFPQKARQIESAFPDGCLIHSARGEFFEMRATAREPSLNCTYILKPDYQPEPEYVDLEIELLANGFYGACKDKKCIGPLPYAFTPLHCLPSLLGFDHFVSEGGQTLHLEHIAQTIRISKKVYARFRTGE